jgi:V8-like Glu-specific endopeptidase
MKLIIASSFIVSCFINFSVNAARVSKAHPPAEALDQSTFHKPILSSPNLQEEVKRTSDVKESGGDGVSKRKHAVKSSCCCIECCTGGCKQDRRQKVSPDDPLYSPFVCIMAYFPSKGWQRGTATIISENCLITAAHCLYNEGEYATEVMAFFEMREVVSAGCCGCKTRTKDDLRAYITRPVCAVFPDFLKNPSSPYDLAIFTLKAPSIEDLTLAGIDPTPYATWDAKRDDVKILLEGTRHIYDELEGFSVGKRYGLLNFVEYAPEDLKGASVSITGYPTHVGRSCKEQYNMYSMKGKIRQTTEDLILHDIDTSDGNSGSGVCLTIGDETAVVGIHTGEYNDSLNQALLLNSKAISFLDQYVRGFDRKYVMENMPMTVEV